MEKTIKLASVLLKCSLGTGIAEEKKKKSKKHMLNLVLMIAVLPLMYYLFRGGCLLQGLFASVDGDGMILRFVMFVASAFIFAAGIVSCINTFYLSSNLECLLVMPFTSGQITGAKLIVAAVYEYYISLFVLGPLLAGYGYAGRESALYWIGALLAVLLLPIVPLTNAAMISMIVMRLLGSAKNKERTAALGAVGLLAAFMVYDIIRNAVQGMDLTAVENTIDRLAKSISHMTAIFPDIPFLAAIMADKNIFSLVWCILIVAASVAIFLIAARFLYFSGAVGMQSASASYKKLTDRQMNRLNRKNNIVRAYTVKELKIIFRTPAYYIQCLFLTLGWPVLVIVPELFSKPAKSSFGSLMKQLSTVESPVYFIFLLFCAVFVITMFAATLNGTAPFAISREGRSFSIMKQLPISYKKQLKAKRNAAFIICAIGSGVYMVIGELILILWKGFPWWSIPVTVVFNILILIILTDIEMIFGLVKPRLMWESEGDAASRNMVGFVMFLIGVAVSVVLILVPGAWVKDLECSAPIFLTGLIALLGGAAFLVDRVFYLYGEWRLSRIGE